MLTTIRFHSVVPAGEIICKGDPSEGKVACSRHVISYSLHGSTWLRQRLRQEDSAKREMDVIGIGGEVDLWLTLKSGHSRQEGQYMGPEKTRFHWSHLTRTVFISHTEVWVFK